MTHCPLIWLKDLPLYYSCNIKLLLPADLSSANSSILSEIITGQLKKLNWKVKSKHWTENLWFEIGLGNIAINREYRQISVYNINIACFSFAMLSQRQYLLHCTILIAPKIIVCYCILSRFYGWWILYFLLHKVSFSLLLT